MPFTPQYSLSPKSNFRKPMPLILLSKFLSPLHALLCAGVLMLALGTAGCNTATVIGKRADGTLYSIDSLWPLTYPYAITFDTIPLDKAGLYCFSVSGLEECRISMLRVIVSSEHPFVDQSVDYANKPLLTSGALYRSTLILNIVNEDGLELHNATLPLCEQGWRTQDISPPPKIDRAYSAYTAIAMHYPNFPTGNFKLCIEILSPASSQGYFLTLDGLGFPPRPLPESPPTDSKDSPADTASTLMPHQASP